MFRVSETLVWDTSPDPGIPSIPGISSIPGIPVDVVSSSGARTLPSTRAGGQDDGSYTNSLKLEADFATLDELFILVRNCLVALMLS